MNESNTEREQTGECYVCGNTVQVDGTHAVERWGDILCRACSGETVEFEATCTSELCDWSYRAQGTEFSRGHVKTRAQQEANQHERFTKVFDGNPMHATSVEEVDGDD